MTAFRTIAIIWILWQLTSTSGPKWYGKTPPPDQRQMLDAFDTKDDCHRKLGPPLDIIETADERLKIRRVCLPQGMDPR